MAGKINEQIMADFLAKLLLVHPDLISYNIRYENNPIGAVRIIFINSFCDVLERFAQTHYEFKPSYQNLMKTREQENWFPNSFEVVMDVGIRAWQANPEINNDPTFNVLMASLICVYEELGEQVKGFFDRLEVIGDVTGLNENALLSCALFVYDYNGFRSLVELSYDKFQSEGGH